MTTGVPRIAVLCWEEGLVPRGLVQLETLPGNSTNPRTYPYPVRFCRIEGATTETVLENPSEKVLRNTIEASRRLVAEGVRVVTTSCGFNAIFQNELSASVGAAVYTSSLLQVPLVRRTLGYDKKIAVVTARKSALRDEHLRAVGIEPDMNVEIFGLESCAEWNKIFAAPDEEVDLAQIEREVVGTAKRAAEEHPDIGAFVLECTDLPPFSAAIRRETGLPVHDFTTMVGLAASACGILPSF